MISLLVSLTLTPSLCARWLGRRRAREDRHLWQRISEGGFERLRRGYDRSLGWALAHAPLVVCLLLGVMALNIHLYIAAPKSFLPQQDTGQVGGFIRGDDGFSFQVMQPKIDAFRRGVLADPAVESVAGFIGGGRGINNAWTFIRLKPLAERKMSAQLVVERLRRTLPHVPGARFWMFVQQDIHFGGGGEGGGYQSTLLADDTHLLRLWGERVKRALVRLPELTGFEDQLETSQQVSLTVNRSEASRLGVEMATVTQTLNNAYGQRQVSTIYNALNQYRVVMEVEPSQARGPEALDRLYVMAKGERIPLSAFSGYDRTVAPGSRAAPRTVRLDQHRLPAEAGREPQEAQTVIDRAVARLGMPSSVQGRLEGDARLFQRMQGDQPIAILGTLFIVYIVLGVLYESYIHPLTILSTLPSAGVGALLALQALDTEFSLIAMLGLFLLVGVVMKNAILMIDVALQLEREKGLTPLTAIREACLLRLRPILMTNHGRHARRAAPGHRSGRGRRAAPAARHRHRRRAGREPGADPVHHARRVSLPQSAAPVERRPPDRRDGGIRKRRAR